MESNRVQYYSVRDEKRLIARWKSAEIGYRGLSLRFFTHPVLRNLTAELKRCHTVFTY